MIVLKLLKLYFVFNYIFLRIYIKKVKKFPEYAVDTLADKKIMKLAMDKAFHELKQRGFEGIGQERYLPVY